jgi:hypothetical protein
VALPTDGDDDTVSARRIFIFAASKQSKLGLSFIAPPSKGYNNGANLIAPFAPTRIADGQMSNSNNNPDLLCHHRLYIYLFLKLIFV